MMSAELLRRLAQASAAAYELKPDGHPEPYLQAAGVTISTIIRDPDDTVRGFVGHTDYSRVVAIKGTASLKDALLDLRVIQRPYERTMVHEGFLAEHDRVIQQIAIPEGDLPLYVTGHSLGGAVATLLAVTLKNHYPKLDPEVATFGSPDVGDDDFVKLFNSTIQNKVRVVHNLDIVPRLLDQHLLPYSQVDKLLHLDDQGKTIGKARTWFGSVIRFFKRRISVIDGEALANHHIDTYIRPLIIRQLRLQGHSVKR